ENQAEIAEIYYKKRDVMEYVQPGSSEISDRFFYDPRNPEHATALADIGFAKLQNKEFDKAKSYFDQALEINPDNPYALINLGIISEHEGDKVQAAELYRQVLDLVGRGGGKDGAGPAVDTALQNVARENLKQLEQGQ
ncbi:MAG: tetratricopeptide repeat protein, partial [Desulfobulbaceae bacterium]|nr:tetratricopeptide repeat protein [Desulfobulbaceae bacterium]